MTRDEESACWLTIFSYVHFQSHQFSSTSKCAAKAVFSIHYMLLWEILDTHKWFILARNRASCKYQGEPLQGIWKMSKGKCDEVRWTAYCPKWLGGAMSCDMSKMSTMSCTTRSQGQVRAHYSSVLLCVVFVLCGANASGVGVWCHEMPLSHTHIEVCCKLLMHAHTHAHARACTCTHIHTHTHTYTHIHTYTYVTHGHTHTLSLSLSHTHTHAREGVD